MLEKIKFNYSKSKNQSELFTVNHKRFDITIEYNGVDYTCDYQCNPKFMMPNKEDVVECLLNDLSAYENNENPFDFMLEFGYSDASEAERCYNACKRTSEALREMFTQSELDELNEEIYG